MRRPDGGGARLTDIDVGADDVAGVVKLDADELALRRYVSR